MTPLPPPTIAALLAVWCGAQNGGAASSGLRSGSTPATEWMAVTSSAAAASRRGSTVGIRSASMVLPAPGGPSRHRWWPPAAQISAARRAAGWPSTSARSGARPGGAGACGAGTAGAAPPSINSTWPAAPPGGSPRSQPSRPRNVAALATRMPGTRAASAALAWGTATRRNPRPAAAATAGSTPRTGRSWPSRPSSPRNATPSMDAVGTTPAALRMATAIPASKPLPRLGRLAGDRPTVIRRCGHCSRLLMTAARIRSLASRSAVSGRPTSSSPGRPF